LPVSASLDGGIPGLLQIGIDLFEEEFGIVRFGFPVCLDPPQKILGQRFSSVGIHLASPFQKLLDEQILIVSQPLKRPQPVFFILRQGKFRKGTFPFFSLAFSLADHQRPRRQIADSLFLAVKPHENQTDQQKEIRENQDIAQKNRPKAGTLAGIRHQAQSHYSLSDRLAREIFREHEVGQGECGGDHQKDGKEDGCGQMPGYHQHSKGKGAGKQQGVHQRYQGDSDQFGGGLASEAGRLKPDLHVFGSDHGDAILHRFLSPFVLGTDSCYNQSVEVKEMPLPQSRQRLGAFVQKNQSRWARLEELIRHFHRRSLSKRELDELGFLYRQVAGHLAYAQTYFPGHDITRRLNELTLKAHNLIYGTVKKRRFHKLFAFFFRDFPLLFYERIPFFLVALSLFSLGALLAFFLTLGDPRLASLFFPPGMAESIDPQAGPAGEWNHSVVSGQIMVNNIQVAFLCFAFGALLGVGT